jgi:hypothetical protein
VLRLFILIIFYYSLSTMKKNKNAPLGKALIKSIQKKNFVSPHDEMAIFFQKSETN